MRGPGGRGWKRVAVGALALGGVTHGVDARADDRGAALAILQTVDPATADDAIKRSRDALERATRMRVAGDEAHARLAEGLGREWAETARDLARAVEVEKQARASELAAMEAGGRVERERALLEDAIARAGRLRAELAGLAAKADAAPPRSDAKPKAKRGAPAPPPKAAPPTTDADAPARDGDRAGKGRP